MAVDDHGLEVLKKAAVDPDGDKRNYFLQTTPSSFGPFAPPPDTDFIERSVASNVETYNFRQGGLTGTILKVVTITYTDSTLASLVSVEVT